MPQWDEKKIADWVDQKTIDFVDTYLRLETLDQYQADNIVTDPACGMRINRPYAAKQIEYGSKTSYFCLRECMEKFAADPDKYLGVGKEKNPQGT